ncbi:MAG: hypothetical protein JST22_21355 [Bacteroidetes bacterium]|nr:hypothetical protein [Bacteroidota bacterium]
MPIPAGFDFSGATLLATLSTTVTVNGTTYSLELLGARSCPEDVAPPPGDNGPAGGKNPAGLGGESNVRTVPAGIAIFSSANTPLGSVTVFTDPRVSIQGQLTFAVDNQGNLTTPATSSFQQVMVFHVVQPDGSDSWLYGGATWEVTSSVNSFPPANATYTHAAASSGLYDLLTGTPNVATKGTSTIALGRVATAAEESDQLALYNAAVATFNGLGPVMAAPEVAAN